MDDELKKECQKLLDRFREEQKYFYVLDNVVRSKKELTNQGLWEQRKKNEKSLKNHSEKGFEKAENRSDYLLGCRFDYLEIKETGLKQPTWKKFFKKLVKTKLFERKKFLTWFKNVFQ